MSSEKHFVLDSSKIFEAVDCGNKNTIVVSPDSFSAIKAEDVARAVEELKFRLCEIFALAECQCEICKKQGRPIYINYKDLKDIVNGVFTFTKEKKEG